MGLIKLYRPYYKSTMEIFGENRLASSVTTSLQTLMDGVLTPVCGEKFHQSQHQRTNEIFSDPHQLMF